MEIVLIIFLFYMLHIQFLVNYLLTGNDVHTFFGWKLVYCYSEEIAEKALLFTLLSLLMFVFGYIFGQKKKIINKKKVIIGNSIIRITEIFYLISILSLLYVIIKGGFEYSNMTIVREQINFIFELRMISNVLLLYMLFNSDLSELRNRKFKFVKKIIFVYVLLIFFIQARSLVFEILAIFSIYYIKIKNIKVEFKYIVLLFIISVLPNIIVIFRLDDSQLDFSSIETYQNIFTYEYSLLFNNILSEVISNKHVYIEHDNFLINALILLVPSFLRDKLALTVDDSFNISIANDAGVTGGGFSLLGQLYLNFGYWSVLYWLIMGYLFGRVFKKLYMERSSSVFIAIIPLVYVYFVLSFRNDLYIFLKQIVQLYMIALFLNIVIKTKYNFTKL